MTEEMMNGTEPVVEDVDKEEMDPDELAGITAGKDSAHKINSRKCAVCNGSLCEYKGFWVCKKGHVFANKKSAVVYSLLIRTDADFAKKAWSKVKK